MAQEDGRPYSQTYGQHYWSGGAAEKTHVFLQGNQLAERFAAAGGKDFTVAELGFGTALNFLLTAQLWQTRGAGGQLAYIGYEQSPLPSQKIRTLHHGHPLCDDFLACYKARPGWNVMRMKNVELHLYVGEALQGIAHQPRRANAWFLDGFSPEVNPEMWSPQLLGQVAGQSGAGATFATYSVARQVRQALEGAGFGWKKTVGFPPKRHMLCGSLNAAGAVE